ncbi:hypothetical protein M3196_09250 [Fictibacillus nanhaiensis]|uniref:hypothetical protein n=1 Tax=Fictibacillus nanhaiensis TaxID=742169 RepID=UPI00203D57CF|nr:hypothetical protein [Fictibacillus nanhaiensis]MCM3731849.1 hypothetical protein [Fictibacillus nanhaiensis]
MNCVFGSQLFVFLEVNSSSPGETTGIWGETWTGLSETERGLSETVGSLSETSGGWSETKGSLSEKQQLLSERVINKRTRTVKASAASKKGIYLLFLNSKKATYRLGVNKYDYIEQKSIFD